MEYNKNKMYIKPQTIDPEVCSILIFQKILIFQEKCLSCYILLTDQISYLIAITSRNIGQYVYYDRLLTRLRRHKIQN